MKEMSTKMSDLGIILSFFQVEFGMDELHACWDGFVHTSDHYEQQFSSKTAICKEFTNALKDYREYLDSTDEVGLSIH